MIRKNSGIVLVLFFFVLQRFFAVSATDLPSADVTMIGINQAIFSLQQALKTSLTTVANEQATLEINDAIVEKDRILVRFFVWGLPYTWEEKVSDNSRVYGSYLPVAELGTPAGVWLTPSSGSRFSLLSNGNELVIAGLLEFLTEEQPQVVSFNFNQIPFDTEPLAEGAAIVLNLQKGDAQQRLPQPQLSQRSGTVEMFLMNTAQTPEISMLQPGFKLSRQDETLTKVGWFAVERTDGARYLLTRNDPYGFNLANDQSYLLRNAYLFSAMHTNDPLRLTLDYVYLSRNKTDQISIRLSKIPEIGDRFQLNIPLKLDEFEAKIEGYQIFAQAHEQHEHPILRLFLSADPRISQIRFQAATELIASECGFLPDSNQFACDVPLLAMTSADIDLAIHGFEYRLDGNWEINWTPNVIHWTPDAEPQTILPMTYDLSETYAKADDEVREAADLMQKLSDKLSARAGWIYEKTRQQTGIPNANHPDLILHEMKDEYATTIINEKWIQLGADGEIISLISLIRNTDERLLYGSWNLPDMEILLPQGLKVSSRSNASSVAYLYGGDFFSLLGTSAIFLNRETCELDGAPAWCYFFEHSLQQNSEESANPFLNRYQFWIQPDTGKILKKQVDCNLDGQNTPIVPCVTIETLALENREKLDTEVQNLIEAIVF